MMKTYRVTRGVRVQNAIVGALLRVGVKIGPNYLLTVRGRKSGTPRTTPVALVRQGSTRYLIAPFGSVNWVRNLRAAGMATLLRGRRSEAVRAVELQPVEAAPVLKQVLQ